MQGNKSIKYRLIGSVVAMMLLTLGFSVGSAFAQEIDPNIPDYRSAQGISGKFSSRGSDTLNNLMTLWSESFKKYYPAVTLEIQGAGSSTAPPALIEGTANVGPMSRVMKAKEIEAFEKRYGYAPTPIPVAIDAVAVIINRDNPVNTLTKKQVDAIYSVTRKCGGGKNIRRWGQASEEAKAERKWKRRRITLYGRNSVSGTYGYFKSTALCKGDFKSSVNEQPGSASVVQSVSTNLGGIGYTGVGYLTSDVKQVGIAAKGRDPVWPTLTDAATGAYPLSRFLYIYVNLPPNRPLPPMEREFLKLILSQEGQRNVVKGGYIPLPNEVVQNALASARINR